MEKNISVIGCGYWGKNLVRNFYELNKLHSICDSDEVLVKSLREKYPDVPASHDYKDVLKNPGVNAVVIATPAASHYSIAKEALEANKDVLVEKPLALHYSEGEELVSIAKERDRILMVGHILEYHPAIVKLKEIVNSGEMGNIKYIYSNRLNLGKFRTEMPVTLEDTQKLFAPSDCPQTALYCGWYSLEKYIDAFDFVDGAIGFHIASFEAVDLRDSASGQWCPAMLADGITVTLGPVAEPYLSAFPRPKDFFLELFNSRCIVEAFYRTKPFNSWQLVLIGDPLYTPFKKR